MIEHPMDATVPVTQDAMFKCVGQGYGLVNVRWVRVKSGNEKSLPSKSTVTTMVTPNNITTITSILTIPNLVDNDGNKNYKCIYNNSKGKIDSSRARLTIGSKCLHIMYVFI